MTATPQDSLYPRRFIRFLGTAGARFTIMRQLRASGGIWVGPGDKSKFRFITNPLFFSDLKDNPGCMELMVLNKPELEMFFQSVFHRDHPPHGLRKESNRRRPQNIRFR
ncbi:MAG: hypothetical protein EOM17_16095 [Synergistales bacterium]|nr:hypothetical protein [Synergistales bacterium]